VNADYVTTQGTSGATPGNVSGFISSSEAISDTTGCSTCQFVGWGVWSASVNNGTETEMASLVPYVAGKPSSALEWSNYGASVDTNTVAVRALGPVTYTGSIIGAIQDNVSGDLNRYASGFEAAINLNTRQITGFNNVSGTDFGGYAFNMTTASVNFDANAGTFSNVPVQFTKTGFDTMVGAVNGALFGPLAQEVGGNFAVQAANTTTVGGITLPNEQAAGVFIGVRP
jgi:hypothetical protein